jgi:hypothetical protein
VSKYDDDRAAELKAKLDMVTVQPKPRHGRDHRKIGMMTCFTGVKSGNRETTASFVLRLDSDTGSFIAEHNDTQYVSKSRDALQAKMNEVARVTIDVKWSRYLLVDYEAIVPYRDNWNSTTTLSVDQPRDKDVVLLGLKLEWEVVEYSDAIHLPGQGERFMKRDVHADGKPSSSQETVPKLPDGLVAYTKEREGVLLRLRAALASVDAKMVELFRGDRLDVARALDNVGTKALLLEDSMSTAATARKSKR